MREHEAAELRARCQEAEARVERLERRLRELDGPITPVREGHRHDDASLQFREAVRAAHVGLWDWDLATNRVRYSAEYQRQIGHDEDEFGEGFEEWRDRVHPSDLQPTLDRVQRALESGQDTYEVEFRFRHKDGTYRWILAQSTIWRDVAGRAHRVVGSHIDITEQKRVQESLQRSVRLRELLVEISATYIDLPIEGLDARIAHSLREIAQFVGADRAFVVEYDFGRELATITHEWTEAGSLLRPAPTDPIAFAAIGPLLEAHGAGRPYCSGEEQAVGSAEAFEGLHRRGPHRLVTVPMFDEGRCRGSVGVEVPERQRTTTEAELQLLEVFARLLVSVQRRTGFEAALRASEERFRLLLEDVAMVSVQGYAEDGTTLYWNRGSERLYGYRKDEALGRNLLDLIIPDEMRDEVAAAIQGMARTGIPVPAAQLTLRHKDGSPVEVFSSHSIVRRPGARPEFFCIDVDLSEMRRTEHEREALRAQLLHAQKMESIGRLAGGVAHDFNNMLSVILGQIEVVLEDLPARHPLQGPLREVEDAARRSAQLTKQLLAFARKQAVRPKILELNQAVSALLEMLQRLIGERIELRFEPGPRLPPVRIDPAQLDQVLANLLVNARDAIGSVGTVTIRTSACEVAVEEGTADPELRPGRYVRLSVQDTGHGMDAQTLAQVFEPFFTTKGVGEGTGLGLATVYGIMLQNGGFARARSEPGHGAEFELLFPVVSGELPRPESARASPDPAERGGEEILLVEDEDAIRTMIAKMLERLGYTVISASGPLEALELVNARERRIRLLLTDVVMPQMTGLELAARLLAQNPDLRCLYMSGYTAETIEPRDALDPDQRLLQKPFSWSELARAVREVLNDPPEERTNAAGG